MEKPAGNGSEAAIGDLFGRLADEGKAYVQAEIALYKAIAARRADAAKYGAVAIAAAIVLLNAALVALMVLVGVGIAIHLGPIVAGLIVFAAAAVIALLLLRFGAARLKALSGDPAERAALAAGERTS